MADPLAIYGAAIGTVAALGVAWNIHIGLRDRGRLRITAAVSKLSMSQEVDLASLTATVKEWLDCISIQASNIGRRPMTVGQCTLKSHDGRALWFATGASLRYGRAGAIVDDSHRVPKRLEESEFHTYLFPLEQLRKSLSEDKAFLFSRVSVQAGAGKPWRSRLGKNLISIIEAAPARDSSLRSE